MLTISSPNTDRTLLTIAELRSAVGVADGSKDTELRLLGGYVSASITKACRIATAGAIPPTLRLETVTETFRMDSGRHRQRYRHHASLGPEPLILSRIPVVSVSSVTENGTALDGADYEFEASAGFLYRLSGSCRISWCGSIVTAEYSSGYAVVPDDLKYAALKYVKLISHQEGRDPLLKRESLPGVIDREWWVEPSREVGVPPEVMDLLEQGGFVNEVLV